MAVKKLTPDLSQKIFIEFCEGELLDDGTRQSISLDALQKKHNVARATLYRRAEKENWQQQKIDFISKTREKLKESRAQDFTREAGQLDNASLALARGFLGRVASVLRNDEISARENQPTLTPQQLASLSAVAMNAQKIGKLALGEASEITKVNADVTVPDSYRTVMDQLRELRESRAETFSKTLQ
ncbi:MAG: hypothetical protein VW683_02805 [Betaproteobacteria bacterium]